MSYYDDKEAEIRRKLKIIKSAVIDLYRIGEKITNIEQLNRVDELHRERFQICRISFYSSCNGIVGLKPLICGGDAVRKRN